MHLNEIDGLKGAAHDVWRDRLFALNIRHSEQVGSLLASPMGRRALERLGVPVDEIQQRPTLRASLGFTFEGAPERVRPALWTSERNPMGFSRDGLDSFRSAGFDSELPSPEALTEFAPTSELPRSFTLGSPRELPALNQGQRGTCVAFTVLAMYQLMRIRAGKHPARLSAQYLYYLSKLDCPLGLDEEGTSLDVALQVLCKQGCCLEQNLDYSPRHEIHQPHIVEGHRPHRSAARLVELAKNQRIRGYRHLPRNVAAIKAELVQRRPVGVGVAVYELAWYLNTVRTRGEVILPPLEHTNGKTRILDNCLGGHALTLVGYQDNDPADKSSHRPGGGYFVFRNSWGEQWAPQNKAARGYGYLPYEYVERFLLEAAVIDELEAPSAPRSTNSRRSATKQGKGDATSTRKPRRSAAAPPKRTRR